MRAVAGGMPLIRLYIIMNRKNMSLFRLKEFKRDNYI